MIIRGKSPPLLSSSYASVIKRNNNQRHLIRYTCIEKDFLTLQYVKISIKTTVFVIDIPKQTNSFITYFKLMKSYQKPMIF